MKSLRTSLVCLALLASAAACSDANPLAAPGAPRFDGGGLKGSGGRADSTADDADDGGQLGSGNNASTEDGGGFMGSGGKEGGGVIGSGGITSTEEGGEVIGDETVAPERAGGHVGPNG